MNVEQLRHILRAAAAVTGEKIFIVIGSQAILGSHPDAPRSLRKSVEGDTYPKNHPEKSIELLTHRLLNRGKILKLINSEQNQELKQQLLHNWAIVMSKMKK